MNKRRITYAIIPLIIMLIWLFITYFGNQFYAEAAGIVGTDYSNIFLRFNELVPFLDWSIYPYIIAYPVWGLSVFIVAYYSKDNFYNILSLVLITFFICGVWWFFFQSDVESWRVTSGLFLNGNYLTPRTDLNFTESIVMWIYQSAGPRNALPSMHTLISWICIIGIRRDKKIPLSLVLFTWIMNVAIILSTQTTKQHYVIDMIASLVIAEATYWIIKDSKFSKWVNKTVSKWNQHFKLDWDGVIR
ncbi:MAG: phosphatase PAP2 family protein [Tenericutes bacterium]|nr:phosphatase PAP2 family protein [Mycoplasmatota bacterium]